MKGIILFEGADSSGKTTLARYFVKKHGAHYIHGRVHKDAWKWHNAAIRRALRFRERGELTVIDRNYISHLVYGRVFNNQQYDAKARLLDDILRRNGALTVLCSPDDQLRQIARWEEEKAAGRSEAFDRIKEVVALYADLARGNVAHPGNGYLDEMIRFGDFSERQDVLIYDVHKYWGNPAPAARAILRRLHG
jgi:thymidylate kinase